MRSIAEKSSPLNRGREYLVSGVRDSSPVRRRALTYVVILLASAVPAGFVFEYIWTFGVNTFFMDEWELVRHIQASMSGQLSLERLFQQHNEHRVVFPRLLLLGIGSLTRFNTVAWMFAGWACLLVFQGTLVLALRRFQALSAGALALFALLSWTVFSFRQWENMLWGWQLSIFLLVTCWVAALYVLTSSRLSTWQLGSAICLGTVATFSFANGLLVWPLGATILVLRVFLKKEDWRAISKHWVAWVLAGGAMVAAYGWGYHKPHYHPSVTSFVEHPINALSYFFISVGGAVAEQPMTALVAGVSIVVASAVGVWVLATRQLGLGGLFGLGLVGLGLSSSFVLMVGRSGFGQEQALSSRYTTITMLALVGLVFVVEACSSKRMRHLGRGLLVTLFLVALVESLHDYRARAAAVRALRMEAVEHLKSGEPPNTDLRRRLFPDPSYLEQQAAFLREHRLSMFK
jgi:hypothetical protein